ncbi:MAG TPA: tRNA (N6-threonylcarbamoyladenosine(37)-N6)-methyltransferase TrmO [Verrucomicrobiae bacterium]|nr:tRNA (N6-threonylcarbamoyladenosine(37)-N6)-methyltransferase TrmO [Verrucomicrobiae bacterium]
MNKRICFKSIGVIRTPYQRREDAPRRPCAFPDVRATAKVWSRYQAGLRDLGGFSHVLLVYHLHLSQGCDLVCRPFVDPKRRRGVFATRAPRRPNPIGITVARLLKVRKDGLEVSHVDMVDGTPLLDIKPYIPEVGEKERVRLGWLARVIPKLDGCFPQRNGTQSRGGAPRV